MRESVLFAGLQVPGQPLSDVEGPSPDAAAQESMAMGSPLFKQVPRRKRSVFVEAARSSSPSSSQQAHPHVEQHLHHQQVPASVDAAVRIDFARELGMPGQLRVGKGQAVQQAGPHMMWEKQAAAAQAEQQADSTRQAMPPHHSSPLPQRAQAQPYRQTPMPALSTRVQRAQASLPAAPLAHPSSFILPPPEEDFLILQTALMPACEAEPAGTPGLHSNEDVLDIVSFSDEDEEIDIMTVSPRAEQPQRRYEPEQTAQEAQLLQRSKPAGQLRPQHHGPGARQEREAVQALLPAEHHRAQHAHVALRHEAQGMQMLPHVEHLAVQPAGMEEEIDIVTGCPQTEQPMWRRSAGSAPKNAQGARVMAKARPRAVHHPQKWAQQLDRAHRAAQQAAAALSDSVQEREQREALQTVAEDPLVQRSVQQDAQGQHAPPFFKSISA